LEAAVHKYQDSKKDFANPRTLVRRVLTALSGHPLCLTLMAVLVLGAPSLGAQVLYGTMTGNVTDASGAVIPNANVIAIELGSGVKREVKSNEGGVYTFNDLNPGTYQVKILAEGFRPQQQEGVTVLTNTVARVNITLAVGSTTQEVTVTTAPPLLQTDRAETNYNISPEQIATLPTTSTTGRNFQSLYRLVPGSTPPAEQNSAGSNPQRSQAVNVNGVSNSTNTTRIDGAVDAYPWIPYLAAYLPPTDGIESINVVTGSFNAEQGSAGGSAINVTVKGGTNNFHGSTWEYNSIAQFNAQSWQNRTGIRQKNIYNEMGGSFGGRLIKDKLFFFGDYDRVTVNKAINGVLSVPTANMRMGIFAGTGTVIYDPITGTATGANKTPFLNNMIPMNRIAPAARTLLQNLPLPNYGAAGATTNNYFGSAVNAFERQNADIKITYIPTAKTSFFGRYSLSPNRIGDPQEFGINPGGATFDGGQPGAATGLIQNIGLGATHALSSHFFVDINGGYTRQRLAATSSDLSLGDYGTNQLGIPGTNNNGQTLYGGIPAFDFVTYANLGNSNSGSPFTFRDNQYTVNANATFVKGTHSIRFGGEYIHAAINHVQPGSSTLNIPRGGFLFSGGVTSGGTQVTTTNINSFADFLLGQAYNYAKGIQSFNPEALRISTYAFYAQDTWQATRRLVINFGVRYEYYPLPVTDHFGTVRYDPSVRSTVTDSFGTHTVGTVLIGEEGGQDKHAGTTNGYGQFVPRFGLSFQANPKTVVRSGFGITVDPDNLRNLLQAYPSSITTNVTGANSLVAATSINPGLLTTAAQVGIPNVVIPSITSGMVPLPATVSTVTTLPQFRRGYIESYNLSVQQEFPLGLVSTIAYVGTHAIRQITNVDLNASFPGGGNAGRLLNTTYGANTSNTDVFAQQPFAGSIYNGLQAQLTKMSKHGSTGVIYTFSKAMDDSDNSISNPLTFAYPTYYLRNWALAGYDRKHNFQWWTSYPFPFGKDGLFLQHGVAGYVLGNWRVSTILSRVSGTPFTVTSSTTSLNAPGNIQVADQNYGVNTVLGGRAALSGTGGSYQYLNPAAFATVTAVRFGTSGRNSVRGPGLFDLDVSLKREFPVYEQVRLELSADAFDVTNTPAFANPAANISAAGFGQITTSNANRTLRLSGRITF
jgi:hypothetical protein